MIAKPEYDAHMGHDGALLPPEGPTFVSERSLRALIAIRRDKLLPQVYGDVAIARSVSEAFDALPDWLTVVRVSVSVSAVRT